MTVKSTTEPAASPDAHKSEETVALKVGDRHKRQQDEPLILILNRLIGFAVRILAVLMVCVIFWGCCGCRIRSL